MISKHNAIESHLKMGLTITGLEAIEKFNVYRLSSVIHRLRRKGLLIRMEMVKGEKAYYAKYYINM